MERFGNWNGKRRFEAKLRQDSLGVGGLSHPPGSFSIGPDRGYLSYPGQPEFCWRCGIFGHTKAVCSGDMPSLLLSGAQKKGLYSPEVLQPLRRKDHLFRSCPGRKRTFVELFQGEGEGKVGRWGSPLGHGVPSGDWFHLQAQVAILGRLRCRVFLRECASLHRQLPIQNRGWLLLPARGSQ